MRTHIYNLSFFQVLYLSIFLTIKQPEWPLWWAWVSVYPAIMSTFVVAFCKYILELARMEDR